MSALPDAYAPEDGASVGTVVLDGSVHPTSAIRAYARRLLELADFAEGNGIRPVTDCTCGYPLVWVVGQWQHDAAPYLWGDDHEPHAADPTGPQRRYWDEQDGVID